MDVTRPIFPDRSFDAAVATFLFCTLSDELQVAGMRELVDRFHESCHKRGIHLGFPTPIYVTCAQDGAG
jgi:hypothetical protein